MSEAEHNGVIYFNLATDCEATDPALNDPGLGERATRGVVGVLEENGWRGTFFVIPTDLEAHPGMYSELREGGHEVGLHLHPAAQGYGPFFGIHGPDVQREILAEAVDRFAQVMGERPSGLCMGYGSANDYTYALLVEAGFSHGMCSVPGRILPECASVWAGAPLFMHYAHRYNRVLAGDLDFVEIPATIDWESRMWGGKHPQDLRVELVDAKNHFYTIEKSVRRQIAEQVPVKAVRTVTHNIFEYSDPADFRRQTLEGIITHYKHIVADEGFQIAGATVAELADLYRSKVARQETELALDNRGYLRTDDASEE